MTALSFLLALSQENKIPFVLTSQRKDELSRRIFTVDLEIQICIMYIFYSYFGYLLSECWPILGPTRAWSSLPGTAADPDAAAAAESLQSCPTLCDPIDSSPPGSSDHGILQATILEWVAISFSMI